MKKSRGKARTGNPAKKRRGQQPDSDGSKRVSRWLGRELNAFFSLPEWLAILIVILVAAAAVAVWRWLVP